jgi:methylated-DNA-[protein]-cysteine S-methyltransferase
MNDATERDTTMTAREQSLLRAATDVDDDTLAALRRHLGDAAERDGVLDVAYRTIDSPVGTLLVAATGAGVVRLAFERQDHDAVLDDLARRVSPRVLRSPKRLDPVARELEEYFSGGRRGFDLPLDWRLSSGFRRQVLAHLVQIPYGVTESYALVAQASGNPKAVRAVGTACATNPLPLVVPCHRVVRSDGTVGEYAGGPEAKRMLLSLEGRAA